MNEKTDWIDDNLHWYKDAIIYELHIKAFKDSNGDGIGDFNGLIEKLDYLQDLGVTAIWVLPFYPSPLRDDGYDISDYYDINPSYGTIGQFKRLLKEAHKRNLKVVTELVINHTSDQHPWFQQARMAPKGSRERDYYVWSDDPNKYREARIIFQDYETSNWSWDPVAKQYYWHRFFHHQPDLNYDNPKVQREVIKILDYWCKMGVDGFRLDAVPYLFEREGTNCENLPETHQFLKKLRAHVDKKYPGTLLLAEANMWPEEAAAYFGDGDECQMNYHFPVMPRMFMALRMEDKYPITDIFDQTPEIPETCQWAIFLRNHDELTLEMVTDEERDYMYKVYAKDPKARINVGIRHRLAPLMGNDRRRIELLNYLLFSLPGTPVIYYGDEIGMGDNFYLGDRDGVRTPMQWSPDRNAGFSTANPQKLYLPVILDPEYSYEAVNVETQRLNTSSLFWWTKRMIHMRKRYKAFGRGDLKFVQVENAKVLAFTRTWQQETILVVVNLSRFAQAAHLDLDDYSGHALMEIFSKNHFPEIQSEQPYLLTLAPYAYNWFLVEPVHAESGVEESLPVLHFNFWSDITSSKVMDQLESRILPEYLARTRWFGGKAKSIYSIELAEIVEIKISAEYICYFTLIRVNYESGMPDLYQLPLAYATDASEEHPSESWPQSVLCRVMINNEEGVLYDALYGRELQQFLFRNIASNNSVILRGSKMTMHGSKKLKQYLRQEGEIKSKVLAAEQSNTSIVYDNDFFLKLYRKLDHAINPDLEINRFLSDTAGFKHIPKYAGSISWHLNDETIILGMMQELVPNQGDAWNMMIDKLGSYNERILTVSTDELPSPVQNDLLFESTEYDQMSENTREILDLSVAEKVKLLGKRTGEMHIALASNHTLPDFKPEEFSLHYQRSLFSSLQSLVRHTYQLLNRKFDLLNPEWQVDAKAVIEMRGEVLEILRRIYKSRIDALKIRNHGDYHLGQALYTGNDFVILDFEGEPARSFSERRLKRSPLRDVAGMIRSFHYAAHTILLNNGQYSPDDVAKLTPWADYWYQHMSGFFLKSYSDTVKGLGLIPSDREDLSILIETYLLEKSIYELNYELNNRPEWAIIPIRGIKSIIEKHRKQNG